MDATTHDHDVRPGTHGLGRMSVPLTEVRRTRDEVDPWRPDHSTGADIGPEIGDGIWMTPIPDEPEDAGMIAPGLNDL